VLLPLWTSDHDGLTVASFLMIRSLTLTAGTSFAEVAFKVKTGFGLCGG